MKKTATRYPKGWNAKQIKDLAHHYENQSPGDAVAEDEAAYRSTHLTMMAVPVKLVSKVQKMITKLAG